MLQKNCKFDLEALYGAKANVEIVESDVGEIYLIEGKPILFKLGDICFAHTSFQ